MRVFFRALATLFLGASILTLLASLPVRDGYMLPCLWGVEAYCPVLFFLLLGGLLFLSLAAWCHCQANRRRSLR